MGIEKLKISEHKFDIVKHDFDIDNFIRALEERQKAVAKLQHDERDKGIKEILASPTFTDAEKSYKIQELFFVTSLLIITTKMTINLDVQEVIQKRKEILKEYRNKIRYRNLSKETFQKYFDFSNLDKNNK